MKVVAITPNGKQDYLAECIIEGLKELNVDILHTDAGNGLKGTNSDEYVVSHGQDADCILAFWSKSRAPAPRYHLMDQLSNLPVAYIDGSEYNYTGYVKESHPWLWPMMLDRADFYFKRECRPQDLDKSVLPLPFATRVQDQIADDTFKDIDIFCAFGQNHMDPIRAELETFCNKWANQGMNIKVGPCPAKEYQELTKRSRICVNAHGGGQDCMRFWEILGGGSSVFTQKLTIVVPMPFQHQKNIIEFTNLNEFHEHVSYYLTHPDALSELTRMGYQHMLKYHTTRARAQYMLGAMGWDYPSEA